MNVSKMNGFQTKAQTLQVLQGRLSSAQILPMYIFTVHDWANRQNEVRDNIINSLGNGPWIVRSSFSGEDNLETSNAGAYTSVLNVDKNQLESAIIEVISSYDSQDLSEEVFVQPMLENVEFAGVAFSHDPNTGAPDRIIDWSSEGDTQAVTSGLDSRVWQVAAGHKRDLEQEWLKLVSDLIDELLAIFNEVPIDCEFALVNEAKKLSLKLLQVRPLILPNPPKSIEEHNRHLNIIQKKILMGMTPKPFLSGKRTVYGIMPDWNPAEIIGKRPKPLAMSLYQELITDSIWAYQRHNYGYQNLRSHPLMISFLGTPYIDVRVSFNSFIPSDLDVNLADRLVDYYIEKLVSQPSLHDKVEFEIVFSCFTFDLNDKLSELKRYGFSGNDQEKISSSLQKLTNKILHSKSGLWREDAEKLKTLNSKFKIIKKSNLCDIEKIYWLLEDCKRYGTLPFAGLARAAFIGVQMLKSLVSVGVLSAKDFSDFMESIPTISGKMIYDRGSLSKEDFLKTYGHLRPGTYDVLSKRYDEHPELYFNWDESTGKMGKLNRSFSLKKNQRQAIDKLLLTNSINVSVDELLGFIKNTVQLREQAKFEFTKNLSEVLRLIERLGKVNDLSVEELSYCNIEVFLELFRSAADSKQKLNASIEAGKINYAKTLSLSLPPLISKPDDVVSFEWPKTEPNFITQKKVIASTTIVVDKDNLANKILFIPNADPGHDWIFSYPIAGFITAWGGANSHMAIRAGEQGIPAVIGAGEILYKQWSNSEKLMIDCAVRKVEIIR